MTSLPSSKRKLCVKRGRSLSLWPLTNCEKRWDLPWRRSRQLSIRILDG